MSRTSVARKAWTYPVQFFATLFLFLGAPLLAWQADDPAELTFRTGVNFVLLDVSVLGPNGTSIAGLKKEQFQVAENGRVQEIVRFDEGTANVSIALVVDYSGSMMPRHGALLRGMGAFATLLQSGDEGLLTIFNEHPQQLGKFRSSSELNAWTATLSDRRPTGMTSLYDALIVSSRALADSSVERRAIIILSDGKDTSSVANLQHCVDELRSSNRLLYTVGLFEPGDLDTDAGALRKLAASTGGLTFFDRDGTHLPQVFTQIMKDIRARYVLGFYSKEGDANDVRKLAVTVRDAQGHKYSTRSRTEYRIDKKVP